LWPTTAGLLVSEPHGSSTSQCVEHFVLLLVVLLLLLVRQRQALMQAQQ
jgi:hypothetical protein